MQFILEKYEHRDYERSLLILNLNLKKVITDMNPTGNISVEEGSETCLYVSFLDPDANRGCFWYIKKVYDWDDLNLNLSVFR